MAIDILQYLFMQMMAVVWFVDMCRVCRSEGSPEKPLFHPCVCAGSIKYIHQDWYADQPKYLHVNQFLQLFAG